MEIFDVWDSVGGGYAVRAGAALAAWVIGSILLLRRKEYPELTAFFFMSAVAGSIIASQGAPLQANLATVPGGIMAMDKAELVATGWRIQSVVSLGLMLICAGLGIHRWIRTKIFRIRWL